MWDIQRLNAIPPEAEIIYKIYEICLVRLGRHTTLGTKCEQAN
jgi:hypothetical protein